MEQINILTLAYFICVLYMSGVTLGLAVVLLLLLSHNKRAQTVNLTEFCLRRNLICIKGVLLHLICVLSFCLQITPHLNFELDHY